MHDLVFPAMGKGFAGLLGPWSLFKPQLCNSSWRPTERRLCGHVGCHLLSLVKMEPISAHLISENSLKSSRLCCSHANVQTSCSWFVTMIDISTAHITQCSALAVCTSCTHCTLNGRTTGPLEFCGTSLFLASKVLHP